MSFTRKSPYIRFDRSAILQAVAEGKTGELRAEIKIITSLIDAEIVKKLDQKRAAEKEEWVRQLKSIPIDGKVYFIGDDKNIPFGSPCTNLLPVRRKYMTVKFGEKSYNCPLSLLKASPPTIDEVNSFLVKKRITNIFNK